MSNCEHCTCKGNYECKTECAWYDPEYFRQLAQKRLLDKIANHPLVQEVKLKEEKEINPNRL